MKKNTRVRISYYDKGIPVIDQIVLDRRGRLDAKKGIIRKQSDNTWYSEFIECQREQYNANQAVNMKACDDNTHDLYIRLGRAKKALELEQRNEEDAQKQFDDKLASRKPGDDQQRVAGEEKLVAAVVEGRRKAEWSAAVAPYENKIAASKDKIKALEIEMRELNDEIRGIEQGYIMGNIHLLDDYRRRTHFYLRGAQKVDPSLCGASCSVPAQHNPDHFYQNEHHDPSYTYDPDKEGL
jgi:hypothetical protein